MIVAYIDGGARGNPGPAGYGVRIEDGRGGLVAEFGAAIGHATNNVAEYQGLLAALRYAIEHGHPSVTIRSDSLLLVQQMLDAFKVRHAGLQLLHREAKQLVSQLESVKFEHVRREENAEADRLANRAMDDARG